MNLKNETLLFIPSPNHKITNLVEGILEIYCLIYNGDQISPTSISLQSFFDFQGVSRRFSVVFSKILSKLLTKIDARGRNLRLLERKSPKIPKTFVLERDILLILNGKVNKLKELLKKLSKKEIDAIDNWFLEHRSNEVRTQFELYFGSLSYLLTEHNES